MKTNHRSPLLAFWLGLLLVCGSANPLRAEVFGLFFYQVIGGTQITITDYPTDAIGAVTIPAQIAGLPVTAIGDYAFYNCTGLTSVTIPVSVTSLGDYAFSGCTGLTSVTIPVGVNSIGDEAFSGCTGLTSFAVTPGNTQFSSVDGLLYNASGTSLLACPGGRTGGYSIPGSVTSIGGYAFYRCTGLTSVTIPASVTSIGVSAFSYCTGLTSVTIPASVTSLGYAAFYRCTGLTSATSLGSVTSIGDYSFSYCRGLTSVAIPASVTSIGFGAFSYCTGLTIVNIPANVTSIDHYAFDDCTGLKSAVFQGNAPSSFGSAVFANTALGFTVYYFTNRTGFTSPVWQGYPSIRIDPAAWPAATWLLARGLPYNTSLQQDPDGDGVSLLMAYALNLDPRQNLPSRLPAPVLGADSMSIRYYAAAPGITYRVETSRDLTQWTTTGVTLSALDAENKRTASVPRDAANRFLRLVVQ